MDYQATTQKLNDYRKQISSLRAKMRETQENVEPQEVENYVFKTPKGDVSLSELFGDNEDLFIIHNMGKSCAYCTMWADGFNGVLHHLENRAAFVITTPDDPETQQKFAQSRGWNFRMVSHQGTGFAQEMGYQGEHGFTPGVSVYKKEGGKIYRVSDANLGPYDDFCSVWHFFAMIPEGVGGWEAKFAY